MIPKNTKTSDSLRLGLNVTDKVNLKIIDKFVVSHIQDYFEPII